MAATKHTGVHAAQLIARTSKALGDMARADESGPIDQFGMALMAYQVITGDVPSDDVVRLALSLASLEERPPRPTARTSRQC